MNCEGISAIRLNVTIRKKTYVIATIKKKSRLRVLNLK